MKRLAKHIFLCWLMDKHHPLTVFDQVELTGAAVVSDAGVPLAGLAFEVKQKHKECLRCGKPLGRLGP